MKKLLLSSVPLLLLHIYVQAQGCIPVRNVAGFGTNLLNHNIQPEDKWLFDITNRYFEASSTFRGNKFVTDTLVRNKIYTLNISATRLLNKGWSYNINVPVSANSRKNSGDHGGPKTPKHTTRSFGLGDFRFTVYKWLLNTPSKGNIQAGIGLKLPTGDYRFAGYFFRNDSTKVLAPVDQAIQLGDGGTGITTELNAFYAINKNFNVFFQGYYLVNPREQNGVSNLKGRTATMLEIKNSSTEMSVPDQYSIRSGGMLVYNKLNWMGGLRFEGVPAEDLVGGNKGFRRAGFIASVESGVTFKMKKLQTYTNVAVPFKRRSLQTYPDKITTRLNGTHTITQGGFADFLFMTGVSFKL